MTVNLDAPLTSVQGTTLWRQIECRLAEEIEAGGMAEGVRLASEQELAARFGVNRHTVRQAVDALVDRGLVERLRGRGTFVRDVMLDYPIRQRTSFSANLLDQGLMPEKTLRSITTEKASSFIAKRLKVRTGGILIVCRSVGFADSVPIGLSTTMFPRKLMANIGDFLRQDSSVSNALAKCGYAKYIRAQTRVYARMPSDEEARQLKQPVSQPVLISEAVDTDPKGVPLSFGSTVFAGGRVQVTIGT